MEISVVVEFPFLKSPSVEISVASGNLQHGGSFVPLR